MNNNKIIGLLGAFALAAATAAFAVTSATADTNKPAAKAAAPLFDDPVIAKGTGIEIKRSQLDDAFTNVKAAAAARGQNIPDAQRSLLEANLLDELIVTKILAAKATAADKVKATEEAEKNIAKIRKSFPSEEKFLERLKLMKINGVDEMEKKMVEGNLPKAVLERELKSQVTVTDAEVKKFYDENPSRFEQAEQVRASHVLIGTKDAAGKDLTDAQKADKRKKIEELLKRAKAGEDFAKLAKEYSEDPGSKDNGGEYTFPRGQMVPEFESAAFSLKKAGDISDVVTTPFGYHIIKLSEKIPAKNLTLTEVSSDLKDGLAGQKMQKLIPGYIEKVEAEAKVEILDADLKAAKKKVEEDAAAAQAGAAVKP